MENYIRLIKKIDLSNRKTLLVTLTLIVLIASGVALANVRKNEGEVLNAALNSQGEDIAVANSALDIVTVGSEFASLSSTSSWPGEIISLDTVAIQPVREGTLVSWNVHIGEFVNEGQVLGRLSAPPAMPDTVNMLADRTGMTAMARVDLDTKTAYAKKRIAQLEELRTQVVSAQNAQTALLGTSTTPGGSQTILSLKRENLRSILRGSLATTYSVISGNVTLPSDRRGFTLKSAIGAQNESLRYSFPDVFFAALSDINDPLSAPMDSGIVYFNAVTKLVDASLPDDSTLMASDLALLKSQLHSDQQAFIMGLDALRAAQLESINSGKELFAQLRDIDNEIAMLTKDLAESEGSLASKVVAENTVRNTVLGAAAIIAPRSGTISSIMKRPGEYVGPGMPVAVVSGGSQILVRFRVPNNTRKPLQGETISIIRTGFTENVYKAKIIGVGSALDESGSYVADAKFNNIPDWPINASVRVSPVEDAGVTSVKLSSLLWNQKKEPYVWAVSDAGRVYAKIVTLGRTLGSDIEVYTGLKNGDRYVTNPTSEIKEDMLVGDVKSQEKKNGTESSYEAAMRAMGM